RRQDRHHQIGGWSEPAERAESGEDEPDTQEDSILLFYPGVEQPGDQERNDQGSQEERLEERGPTIREAARRLGAHGKTADLGGQSELGRDERMNRPLRP